MGLFAAAWNTKDITKLNKAYEAVRKISSVDKLNHIIRTAPLDHIKIEAMSRLSKVSGGNFQMNESACIDTLLLLNTSDTKLYLLNDSLCSWYMNCLFSGIKDKQKQMDLILKNTDFGIKAVGFIRDEAFLIKIIGNPDVAESLRKAAAERIRDEKNLHSIADNASLPQSVRDTVQKEIDRLNEAEKRRQEAEALRKKQQACGLKGHKMKIVDYLPHGNGGKDALYRCTLCGAEEKWPVEWSSADSV